MPDTGPPWNIPYVDPADIVRDYPQASEDLADAIAAGLSAAGNPGIGSNVVQGVRTTTFDTASDSFVVLTDATLSITPTTNTSRILLFANTISASDAAPRGGEMAIFRDTTQVSEIAIATTPHEGQFDRQQTMALIYVDSPASDTSQTYSLRVRRHNAFGTTRFFWGTLIAIEVAP